MLTIVGLALAITFPLHERPAMRVGRTEALRALNQAAACLAARDAVGLHVTRTACVPPASTRYLFTLSPAPGGFGNGHEWRAEPLGPQRNDPCGTLVLDHYGNRRALGATANGTACWRGR